MKQDKITTIQDKSGKCPREMHGILNRQTEYCINLYNYETDGVSTVFECSYLPDEKSNRCLREEFTAVVKSQKRESQLDWIIYQHYSSKVRKSHNRRPP